MKGECYVCEKPIQKQKLKIYHGKQFHMKCLRKLRRRAKKRFYGNLDQALKEIKDNR